MGLRDCLRGTDDEAVGRADAIIEELRKRDREADRNRLDEQAGGCWLLHFGTTELDQEAARREVEGELTGIDANALDLLAVGVPQ